MTFRPWMSALLGALAGSATIALMPEALLFQRQGPLATGAASAGAVERWACPMMDFIGNGPGNCPVCGMKLSRVTAGELTAEQAKRVGLQTSKVVMGPAVATVRAYGTVRYDERTAQPVVPRLAGRIVKRHPGALHVGALVKKGDPLVDYYSPEAFAAQGELAAAVRLGDLAAIRALRERFERWNLGGVAASVVKGAQPTDTVTLASPYSGLVVTSDDVGGMGGRLPEVGEERMADRPLLRLVDPHQFIVSIQVPEVNARWVREGQLVSFATDDYGELPGLAASVGWVSTVLDPELRTREVHLHLREEKGRLMPGSLVSARIRTAISADMTPADAGDPASWGKFVLVVKTAVLSTGVRNVVWRLAERKTDGRLRFEPISVALGPRIEDPTGNDFYVVRAGLAEGDEVATQGAFLLDSQAQLAGTPSLLFPLGANALSAAHGH